MLRLDVILVDSVRLEDAPDPEDPYMPSLRHRKS
jgi:hypothetical protein